MPVYIKMLLNNNLYNKGQKIRICKLVFVSHLNLLVVLCCNFIIYILGRIACMQRIGKGKGTGKGRILIYRCLRDYQTSALYNLGSGSWLARANGAAAQTAAIQLHALTYNWTRVMQLANTPLLQSTTPGLHPVSIHQTSLPARASKHPITAYYSICRPWKDKKWFGPVGWPLADGLPT